MASYDEAYDALKGRVRFQGKTSNEHAQALANAYSRTLVPAEHISRISEFLTGQSVRPGAGALYVPSSRSMLIPGDPSRETTPGIQMKETRSLAHETGHSAAHHMFGPQFRSLASTPHGTGRLEGWAENYADQALPGSYSGYDYAMRSMDPQTRSGYVLQRGSRLGNIDPRLRGAM